MNFPTRLLPIALILLGLAHGPAIAWADALRAPCVPDAAPEGGKIECFVVGGDKPPVITVRVNPDHTTLINLSVPVFETSRPPWPHFELDKQSHSIEIRPTIEPDRDALGSFIVYTRSSTDISVVLLRAKNPADATVRAIVEVQSPADLVLAKALAEVEATAGTMRANIHELKTGLDYAVAKVSELNQGMDTMTMLNKAAEGALIRFTSTGVNHVMLAPRSTAAGNVVASSMRLSRAGSQGVARVTLTNTGQAPATIGKISMQTPQIGNNHVSAVYIRGARKTPDQHDIATVKPGESANLTIILDDAGALTAAQTVGMSMSQEDQETSSSLPDEIWFYPEPTEPKPHENEGKLSVHLQGVYGAIWLGNPDVQGELDATAIKGLGMRVAYGLSRRFDFEAEAMGAGTGQAEFDGGLARSAALGRVQFGGAMRLATGADDVLIPRVRLGLGLQGASFDVSGSTSGKGDGFEFDALWYFGVGMELRLGESFSAGVGASYEQAVNSKSRSIELGAHLGYTWNP